jgi:hypothetical protein
MTLAEPSVVFGCDLSHTGTTSKSMVWLLVLQVVVYIYVPILYAHALHDLILGKVPVDTRHCLSTTGMIIMHV